MSDNFSKLSIQNKFPCIGDIVSINRGKFQAPNIVRVTEICNNAKKDHDKYYIAQFVNNPQVIIKIHYLWFDSGIAHISSF